jgi:hypothetical protein
MKIFLLGDSFTDNLFKEQYIRIEKSKRELNKIQLVLNNPIGKYLLKLNKLDINYTAKWFDDWLKEWGYDVYNFGKASCSIEDIIYQFSKIKDFDYNEDDRIIINWTHPSRFNWIKDKYNVVYIHPNTYWYGNIPNELFKNQCVNREISFFKNQPDHYLNEKLLPFMEYIVELHSKYKPIVWTPFSDVDKSIEKQKWVFSIKHRSMNDNFSSKLPKNWNIKEETLDIIDDRHFGQYGNYYMAVLFDEIIKNNIGPYYNNDSKIIFDNALDRIKFEKKEFITTFKLI